MLNVHGVSSALAGQAFHVPAQPDSSQASRCLGDAGITPFLHTVRHELDLLAAQLDLELIAGLEALLGGVGLANDEVAVEIDYAPLSASLSVRFYLSGLGVPVAHRRATVLPALNCSWHWALQLGSVRMSHIESPERISFQQLLYWEDYGLFRKQDKQTTGFSEMIYEAL